MLTVFSAGSRGIAPAAGLVSSTDGALDTIRHQGEDGAAAPGSGRHAAVLNPKGRVEDGGWEGGNAALSPRREAGCGKVEPPALPKRRPSGSFSGLLQP